MDDAAIQALIAKVLKDNRHLPPETQTGKAVGALRVALEREGKPCTASDALWTVKRLRPR